MRAAVVGALVLAVLGLATPSASADPAPVNKCTVSDKRLGELSGLAADANHWYAINDGGTRSSVFVLGRDCAVQKVISDKLDPYDVEDLALAKDGTFWLSDTGDNDKKRSTVALISMTPAGKTTLYRLTYPDGAHDTEALLLDRTGVPYLVTKNPLGVADVYRPHGALASPGPTALEHVGSLHFSATGTQGGPVTPVIGSVLVTGGAVNADGTVVALRTYTDAYLYPAPDGDLLAALKRDPVRIPLADEKQGEAIAFDPDGSLVSGSEGVGQPIRVVAGAAALVAPKATNAAAVGSTSGNAPGGKDGLPLLPAALVSVFLVGCVALVVHRRRARA